MYLIQQRAWLEIQKGRNFEFLTKTVNIIQYIVRFSKKQRAPMPHLLHGKPATDVIM